MMTANDWDKRCGKCGGCRNPRFGMCSATLREADRSGLLVRMDGFDPDSLVRRAAAGRKGGSDA